MRDDMNLDRDSPWAVLSALRKAAQQFGEDAVSLEGTGQDPAPWGYLSRELGAVIAKFGRRFPAYAGSK